MHHHHRHCVAQDDIWESIQHAVKEQSGHSLPDDVLSKHFMQQLLVPGVLCQQALSQALLELGHPLASDHASIEDAQHHVTAAAQASHLSSLQCTQVASTHPGSQSRQWNVAACMPVCFDVDRLLKDIARASCQHTSDLSKQLPCSECSDLVTNLYPVSCITGPGSIREAVTAGKLAPNSADILEALGKAASPSGACRAASWGCCHCQAWAHADPAEAAQLRHNSRSQQWSIKRDGQCWSI